MQTRALVPDFARVLPVSRCTLFRRGPSLETLILPRSTTTLGRSSSALRNVSLLPDQLWITGYVVHPISENLLNRHYNLQPSRRVSGCDQLLCSEQFAA